MALSRVRSIERRELDGPAPHGLVGDLNPALGQEFFHVPVAQGETIIEPNRVGDHLGWEAVPMKVAGAVRRGCEGY